MALGASAAGVREPGVSILQTLGLAGVRRRHWHAVVVVLARALGADSFGVTATVSNVSADVAISCGSSGCLPDCACATGLAIDPMVGCVPRMSPAVSLHRLPVSTPLPSAPHGEGMRPWDSFRQEFARCQRFDLTSTMKTRPPGTAPPRRTSSGVRRRLRRAAAFGRFFVQDRPRGPADQRRRSPRLMGEETVAGTRSTTASLPRPPCAVSGWASRPIGTRSRQSRTACGQVEEACRRIQPGPCSEAEGGEFRRCDHSGISSNIPPREACALATQSAPYYIRLGPGARIFTSMPRSSSSMVRRAA